MQNCLSLQTPFFSIKKKANFEGSNVGWEVEGYLEDYRNSLQGGFFDLSHWSILEIVGSDAKDFLQRMTTVNFQTFDPTHVYHGAFLTGKGGVVTLGWFQDVGTGYHLILSPAQAGATVEHIEKFHFAESLQVTNQSEKFAMFGLWNASPQLLELLQIKRDFPPLQLDARVWKTVALQFWRDDTMPEMLWVKTGRTQASLFLRALHTAGVKLLGHRLFEYYRIRNAVPSAGLEATERDIILETNFERAVARGKGCYPGQEVVERIFTYGSVNRKLLPVLLESEGAGSMPSVPFSIESEAKPAGQVVSYAEQPDHPGRAVALAYVNKAFWDQKTRFHNAQKNLSVSYRKLGSGERA